MVWLQFLFSSAVLVFTAKKLAEYGDIIAIRTKLGGLFIGTLLLAGATSLPEFLTTINSIQQNVVNLAAGNLFGSNMFNMLMLALLDMAFWKKKILRSSAMKHAVTGTMAALLIGMAAFFILADVNLKIGWLGLDSLVLIVAYLGGIYLIQTKNPPPVIDLAAEEENRMPALWKAVLGFAAASLVLILVSPLLVSSAAEIASITGLGAGFVGTVLVAVITSLPEMITTITAARIGAFDLAVGNLFGSNMFNMFALGLSDLFYTQGRFMGAINPVFVMTGLLGLILTLFGLLGNITRFERRIWRIEIDAFLLVVVYILGIVFLYTNGTGL